MLSNKMQNGSITGMRKNLQKKLPTFWKKAYGTQLGYGKGSVAEP
jgi:hypothetical protein